MSDSAPPRYETIAVTPEGTVVAEFIPDATEGVAYQSEAELEREFIERVLEDEAGNKTRAAQRLGLDRKTLYRKLDEYAKADGGPTRPTPMPTPEGE